MAYGIILIPEVAVAGRLVDFTREITNSAATISSLSQRSIPHLTLMHVDSPREAALRWWTDAVQRIDSSFPVTLTGLMFAPIPARNYYVPEGGIYVGLEAVRSARLDNAHRTLLGLASESGCTPVGAVGELFRPHISLCVLAEFPHGQLRLRPEVMTTTIECRTAFGELKDYGTFGPDLVHHSGRSEP